MGQQSGSTAWPRGGCTWHIALSMVPASPVIFYGITLYIGLVSALSAFGPFSKGVTAWFRQHVGSAIGVTLSGSSIVALGAIPLIATVIHYHGWRAGYLTLAAFPLLLGLPA